MNQEKLNTAIKLDHDMARFKDVIHIINGIKNRLGIAIINDQGMSRNGLIMILQMIFGQPSKLIFAGICRRHWRD